VPGDLSLLERELEMQEKKARREKKWRKWNNIIVCGDLSSCLTLNVLYKMEETSKVLIIAVSASSAEAIVQDAAARIGLATDDSIVTNVSHRMQQDHVKEEWQLRFIDSFQWKDLGAPIGLVAAIRCVIAEQQNMKQPRFGGSEVSSKKRSAGNAIGETNETTSKTSKKQGSIPPLPTLVWVKRILPLLDRHSYNNLRSASRDIYEASRNVNAPWPQKSLKVHIPVRSIAFSPDSGFLTHGGTDGSLRILNRSDGRRTILEGHTDEITDVSFSPDGLLLASASDDQTIRLWRLADRSCRVLEGHDAPVQSVVFSPDGLSLASGCLDGETRLWDVGNGICTKTLRHERMTCVRSVAFSPDGETLASSGVDDDDQDFGGDVRGTVYGTIILWKISEEERREIMIGGAHSGEVNTIVFSPDGKYLAAGSDDRAVRLWNTSNGSCTAVFRGHSDWVTSVCFSPNGNILASGSGDGSVRLWNVEERNGKSCVLARLGQHQSCVSSVTFSPYGRTLASGGLDETVRLWNPHDEENRYGRVDWDSLFRLWIASS
jgi:WD40 repeat protein